MQDTVEIISAKSVLREGTSSTVCFRKIYSWTQKSSKKKNLNHLHKDGRVDICYYRWMMS